MGASGVSENEGQYTYDEAVELTGNGRYHTGLLATCCVISNAVGVDMFGFALIVVTSSCDLNLTIQQAGILYSIPFLGLLFAYPWGYYADTRGRKRGLVLSATVGFLFGALSSFATTWYWLMILKLVGCSFSTASYTFAMVILGECTGEKRRGQFLLINTSFNLASEVVSFGLAAFVQGFDFSLWIPWLEIYYRPWRLLALLMALPLGIGAFFSICFHESPKFLANIGDTDKALKVLKDMYKTNHGKSSVYPVKTIKKPESTAVPGSFVNNLWRQTAPIFKPPFLWRTLQLYYLFIIMCGTATVFVVWFPLIVNSFFLSYESSSEHLNLCGQIENSFKNTTNEVACDDTIAYNTIISGVSCGLFYTTLNLAVSQVARWRKGLLITTFTVCGLSGIFINLITQPVVSLIFFLLIQGTSICIGICASYFVDCYPTSYRGMVSSLGMMVARLTSFAAINLIGAVIKTYCSLIFYFWAVFIFSGVITALFLPPDRRKTEDITKL